ncbi:hypothetical protein AVI50_04685 [Piscirickettsia salmonis]|nr:hypothetical protein AVI50_04685 [Piscirickettsia salmonis]
MENTVTLYELAWIANDVYLNQPPKPYKRLSYEWKVAPFEGSMRAPELMAFLLLFMENMKIILIFQINLWLLIVALVILQIFM